MPIVNGVVAHTELTVSECDAESTTPAMVTFAAFVNVAGRATGYISGIVPVTVNVTLLLAPLWMVGITTPVAPCINATVKAAPVGHVDVPDAAQVTLVTFKPETAGSLNTAPSATDGPLLVITTSYERLLPVLTLATRLLLVMVKSDTLITVSGPSVAVLLPDDGSLVPLGTAMVAELLTVPLVAVTFAVTVIS